MPNSPPWIAISSADLTAEIDPRGAQLSVLRDRAGRDLLWNGDPAVWTGRAPLLFPIVGALAGGSYRLGSRSYPLARHGFARGKLFSVQSTSPTVALFQLRADADTLQVYPFHFALEVRFELKGATLTVATTVRNEGDEDLPASVGYHPAFRWPLPFGEPRSAHGIQFDTDEPAPIRRIDAAGLLTPERHPTPVAQRRLALDDALFQSDVIIFDQLESRSVLYGGQEGPQLQVSFTDAPYLGIWTKPGAPFICIEPWHGVTDPAGFTGDFKDKPGIFVLAAGETHTATMAITLNTA